MGVRGTIRSVVQRFGLVEVPDTPRRDFLVEAHAFFDGLPGADLTVLGDSLAASGPWSELLVEPVAVRAVSGARIADVVRWVPFALAHRPTRVVVWAGTNDVLEGRTVAQIGKDYAALLAALAQAAPGVEVTCLSVPPLRSHEGAALAASETMRRAADSARWVDVTGVVSAPGVLYDGVHITAVGYVGVSDELRSP